MPLIDLRRLSNFPGAISGDRKLSYSIYRFNAYWLKLKVVIPVRYRFLWEDELWTGPRKTAFMRDFERLVDRAWSRQHLLRKMGSIFTETHCEVEVRAERRAAAQNQRWLVVALPPEMPRGHTRVLYEYSGVLPPNVPLSSCPEPHTRYDNEGLVVISEADLACGYGHLLDSDNRRPNLLQIGAAHEVGHMLGMQHPACGRDEHGCYGHPRSRRGESIMGLGSRVRPEDYLWAVRILNHAESGAWEAVESRDGAEVPVCVGPNAWPRV